MAESEWNIPLILIFLAFIVAVGISMAIPDGVTIVETCKTIDSTTTCIIVETYT